MNETFIIANRTDTGKTRRLNEDSMVTFDSPNGRVVAVCDGMGGQAAGDVASRLACDIITDILENNTFATPNEAITRAVLAANQGILHRAAANPDLEGMGATCVIAIIKDGRVSYGWVGDSRIYYVSDNKLTRISRDQSYVQSLIDSGQITAAEAENHPRKNEIVNALGLENMTPPELGAIPLQPTPGSVLMLCSDGLSGMVSEDEMQRILDTPARSLQQKADALIDAANAAGGLDNITVQLVQFNAPAAVRKSGIAGRRPSMLNTIVAAVALVIIGVAGYFMFRPSSPSEGGSTKGADEVVDTRSGGGASVNTVTTRDKQTTTTVVNDRQGQFQSKQAQPKQPKQKSPDKAIVDKNKKEKGQKDEPKKDKTSNAAQGMLGGKGNNGGNGGNGGKHEVTDEDLGSK